VSSSGEKFPKQPEGYVHLRLDGGWGVDTDVWITSDDHFRVRSYSAHTGAIHEEREGVEGGSFTELVTLADSLEAWELTPALLDQDVRAASGGRGAPGLMDFTHAYIEFRTPDRRVLRADFYAAGATAEHYPSASRVAAFAKLEAAIFAQTQERKQAASD
jgi:hypothetical protein